DIQAGGVVVPEYWQLKIQGALPNQCTINEGANADIVRVLADPTVNVISPGASFLEKQTANLNGSVNYTQVVSAAPPAGLPALPVLRATWSQTAGAATATPAAVNFGPYNSGPQTTNTSAIAPSVYTTIYLNYRLKPVY